MGNSFIMSVSNELPKNGATDSLEETDFLFKKAPHDFGE
jgi:hypothetical protein